MKHTFNIEKYDGSLEELARDIASMRYNRLATFLYNLSKCIKNDSAKDTQLGRKKLGNNLKKLSEELDNCTYRTNDIWDDCVCYMDNGINHETHCRCPHCGHVQTHEECGTYDVMFPVCVKCDGCTTVG